MQGNSTVADLDLELRGGGGGGLIYLPCWLNLPSVVSSFFTQNKIRHCNRTINALSSDRYLNSD